LKELFLFGRGTRFFLDAFLVARLRGENMEVAIFRHWVLGGQQNIIARF
jgi:hypothetical protein